MTTSGTSVFNLDLNNLVEESFERCGKELRTGYDLRTARRSLNLLTIEWANRGINLWTMDQGAIPLGITATDTTITVSNVSGLAAAGFIKIGSETISYPNVDVTNNQLLNCARGQNYTTAAAHLTGAAISVQNLPCVNLWPTPNAPGDQYTLVYWRLRRMQDAGNGVNTQDIPFRLLPCLVAGLAFYLAIKLEGVPADRIQMLKMHYEEQWTLASSEDRETAPLRIVPRNLFYSG
jgi:hypothetical protein